MRRVDHFSSEAELNRKLKQLEENVSNEFERQSDPKRFRVVRVRAPGAIVQPGDLALVDNVSELLLATPVPAFEGKEVVVIVRQGSLAIRPVGTRIDNAASVTVAALSTHRIFCADGQYYS